MSRFNKTSEQKTSFDNDEAGNAGSRFPLLHTRHAWEDNTLNTKQSGSMSAVASYNMADDDLEPSRPIQVVHSSPQINLRSILKHRTMVAQRADTCGDKFHTHGDAHAHHKKVKWVPEVDVFYYAGDAEATHAKEALSEELDQHARKAEFASGYSRVGVSTVDRRPFLDTPWPSADPTQRM